MNIPQVDNDLQKVVPEALKVPLSYEYLLDFRSLDGNIRLRDVNRHETVYSSSDLLKPAYICEEDHNYRLLFMDPAELIRAGYAVLPRNHLTPHMALEAKEPKTYDQVLLECNNDNIGKSSEMSARKYFAKQNEYIDMLNTNIRNQLQRLNSAYASINSLNVVESSVLYDAISRDRIAMWNKMSPGGKYISMMIGFPDIVGESIVLQKYGSFMKRYAAHSVEHAIFALNKE